MQIARATTEAEILACWPIMSTLRPHVTLETFVGHVRRQERDGYVLVRLEEQGEVCAVAGFVIGEKLAWGRHLYVDDLVTGPEWRSRGHGAALLAWLVEHAREQGCVSLHLDSGVQRFGAHRFYLRHGLDITSHHFTRTLDEPESRSRSASPSP